ncbi:MAG: protein kinase [Planctomycetota bacterium]
MIRLTYEKAAEVFQRALEVPESDRVRFIESACEGEPEVLAVVRGLLRSDAEESFLDQSMELSRTGEESSLDRLEDVVTIGEYRILRVIARGSMGVVYLAEQASPKRQVALKLLGFDRRATPSLLAEATILGRLQHPGIARVLQAGSGAVEFKDGSSTTATFLAMEYIDGVTLRERARSAEMTRSQVARLLLSITRAVEHAHRRGVIHRDLKPSNILLDSSGEPFVIDFGVGLLRDGQNESSGHGGVVGTGAYMAPEQLVGSAGQVDTRVDVYSIGVIGYELLTGQPPHQPTASVDDALLDRMRTSQIETQRALRHAAGREFARVIARAMNPDRDERYSSATALADDLHCIVEGRPISDDEGSPLRSLWMYGRRHRVTAAALAGAFSLCIAAIVGLAITSSQARREALRADAAAAETKVEALHAQRIAAFLRTAFLGVDPEERGADVTLFEAIDYATERIHRDLADVPEVEADVRSAIGFVYRRQGRLADAFEQTRLAHRLHLELHGPDDERTLASAEELAYLTWIYEGDASSALRSFDQVIEQIEGSNEGSTGGWTYMKAGLILLAVDDLAAADRHFVAAEPKLVEAYGEVYAARSLRLRALVRLYAGQYETAELFAKTALERCDGAAEQEYIVAQCLVTLGEILAVRGRHTEALEMLQDAELKMRGLTRAGGPELAHLDLMFALATYGAGDAAAAEIRSRRAVKTLEASVAPTHPSLAVARALDSLYRATGETSVREKLAGAYAVVDKAFGADHRLSIALLRAEERLASEAGDDHTAKRLRGTIESLEGRRRSRVGPDLHRRHPDAVFQHN